MRSFFLDIMSWVLITCTAFLAGIFVLYSFIGNVSFTSQQQQEEYQQAQEKKIHDLTNHISILEKEIETLDQEKSIFQEKNTHFQKQINTLEKNIWSLSQTRKQHIPEWFLKKIGDTFLFQEEAEDFSNNFSIFGEACLPNMQITSYSAPEKQVFFHIFDHSYEEVLSFFEKQNMYHIIEPNNFFGYTFYLNQIPPDGIVRFVLFFEGTTLGIEIPKKHYPLLRSLLQEEVQPNTSDTNTDTEINKNIKKLE